MKRTTIDFSKHEYIKREDKYTKIYELKLPDTITHRVVFINSMNRLTVTGDFGNWVFCRQFLPNAKGSSCHEYWAEKARINSVQDPYIFDINALNEEIEYQMNALRGDEDFIDDDDYEEEMNFWKGMLDIDDEYELISYIYSNEVGVEAECLPTGKKLHPWFEVILDAFDEMCKRERDVQI